MEGEITTQHCKNTLFRTEALVAKCIQRIHIQKINIIPYNYNYNYYTVSYTTLLSILLHPCIIVAAGGVNCNYWELNKSEGLCNYSNYVAIFQFSLGIFFFKFYCVKYSTQSSNLNNN